MTHVVPDARAEQQANQRPRGALPRDERSMAVEQAASREANYIVQKTERAVEAAILVIDLGINVAVIRSGDDSGGSLKFVFGPAAELNVRGQGNLWRRNIGQRQRHEKTRKLAEALIEKNRAECAGIMRQELRFNAMNAR